MGRVVQLRGATGPVNEGERRVIEHLAQGLPTDWIIFPNCEFVSSRGHVHEADAVVAGHGVVFVIETKDFRAPVIVDEREWVVGSRSMNSPVLVTERKAKVLKGRLSEARNDNRRVAVESLVVLARRPHSFRVRNDGLRARVQEDLATLSERLIASEDRRGPSPAALAADMALQAQSGPKQLADYKISGLLQESDSESWYVAKHAVGEFAPEVRLWHLLPILYTAAGEQDQWRAKAVREIEAMRLMGPHPGVDGAQELVELDDGSLLVVFPSLEGMSLAQFVASDPRPSTQDIAGILSKATEALSHAHSSGVVHRRLSPEHVFLRGGQPDDVVVRGFGLAKLLRSAEGATVAHLVAEEMQDLGGYVAPEVVSPGLGAVAQPADWYGLAATTFSCFAGAPPFASPSEAARGDLQMSVDIPRSLAPALSGAVKYDPSERWLDLVEFAELLSTVGRRTPPNPKPAPQIYVAGDKIGDFEVEGFLGRGGFSDVYRVRWPVAGAVCALKVFSSESSLRRVQREFRALRDIRHPNVVRSEYAGVTADGSWYLVTEFVDGPSLRQLLEEQGVLPLEDSLGFSEDLLDALEAMHPDIEQIRALRDSPELTPSDRSLLQSLEESGVVHRDIKPDNILIGADGAKLIDFNIAAVGGMTATAAGTLRYQAPDCDFGRLDVSADLFAAGVVVYEMVTGCHPYEKGIPRLDRAPIDPRQWRNDLSPELSEFLLSACAPRREDRFASATEMLRALLDARADDATRRLADTEEAVEPDHVEDPDEVAEPGDVTEPQDGAATEVAHIAHAERRSAEPRGPGIVAPAEDLSGDDVSSITEEVTPSEHDSGVQKEAPARPLRVIGRSPGQAPTAPAPAARPAPSSPRPSPKPAKQGPEIKKKVPSPANKISKAEKEAAGRAVQTLTQLLAEATGTADVVSPTVISLRRAPGLLNAEARIVSNEVVLVVRTQGDRSAAAVRDLRSAFTLMNFDPSSLRSGRRSELVVRTAARWPDHDAAAQSRLLRIASRFIREVDDVIKKNSSTTHPPSKKKRPAQASVSVAPSRGLRVDTPKGPGHVLGRQTDGVLVMLANQSGTYIVRWGEPIRVNGRVTAFRKPR